MIVRLLDDYNGIKRGEIRTIADHIARVMIARGIAVIERTTDKAANESLELAKNRDMPK